MQENKFNQFLMCDQFFQYHRLPQLFLSSGLSNFCFPSYAQIFSSNSYLLRSNRRTLSSGNHVRV